MQASHAFWTSVSHSANSAPAFGLVSRRGASAQPPASGGTWRARAPARVHLRLRGTPRRRDPRRRRGRPVALPFLPSIPPRTPAIASKAGSTLFGRVAAGDVHLGIPHDFEFLPGAVLTALAADPDLLEGVAADRLERALAWHGFSSASFARGG